MKFLKNVLAVIVGLIIFTLIGFFIIAVTINAATREKPVVIDENSVLHLKLDKPIADRGYEDPLSELPGLPVGESTYGLIEMKEAIRYAAQDDNIEGILLEAPMIMAGFSITDELRDALDEFRESDKFVIAFSDYYSEQAYYLSSVADEIYASPLAWFEFNGLNANLTFIKGTLDKLEIEPQIFRVGEFKSAVEPFTRKDMSAENEQQITEMITSMYERVIKRISASRGIEPDVLRTLSDSMTVTNPETAAERKLLTGVNYFDEVKNIIKEKIGLEEDEELDLIPYGKYKGSVKDQGSGTDRIAVIFASGEIIMGKGDQNTIGAERFTEEIRKAAESDRIKAIVLRINSPGGSIIASDMIWREIVEARKEKPVIASMSDLAASGGYYLAMACDTIVAQPNTITGSIGIFALIFNLQEFMGEKLGITFDNVKTGIYSDIFTSTRPLNEAEKAIIQSEVEKGYQAFVEKAAEGRELNVEDIKSVASGRIWTGAKAKELGLIDEIGAFEDAVRIAAEKAGIEEYKLRFYPHRKTFFEEFLTNIEDNAETRILKVKLGDMYPYYQRIQQIEHMKGLQARIPFEIDIH